MRGVSRALVGGETEPGDGVGRDVLGDDGGGTTAARGADADTEETRASASGRAASRAGANGASAHRADDGVETGGDDGWDRDEHGVVRVDAAGGERRTVASPASTMKRASASTASTPLTSIVYT